jgi:hypothetical protein
MLPISSDVSRRRWLTVGLTLTVLIAMSHFVDADERPKTVKLVIDYGDGVEKHFTALAWQEDVTVLDVLAAAQKHAHGIRYEFKGRGATTLVTKIDDVENEGNGRNWLYQVNGKWADKSCGTFELQAGDAVLWKFDTYR